MMPEPPSADNVADWEETVADYPDHDACQICGDNTNHEGDYCPSGITRNMADWVRARRIAAQYVPLCAALTVTHRYAPRVAGYKGGQPIFLQTCVFCEKTQREINGDTLP